MAFALHSFSPEAFLYWLPAFLIACVEDPDEASQAIDSVEYRFRAPTTPQEDVWQAARLPRLSEEQLAVLVAYFEYQLRNGKAEPADATSAVSVLRVELQRRRT